MKFVAFDTAIHKTGVAYRDRDGRWTTSVVEARDTAALALVLDQAKAAGVDAAVVEDCYLHTNDRRGNVVTLKRLQEAQTRIVVACEMVGLDPIQLVQPNVWQGAFKIGGDRERRKAGAAWVARTLGASPDSGQDEADAVCLCEYAQSMARQMELTTKTRGGKRCS